ncbi:MAG TPA: PAAR domain-containing protein [Paraburkholderia sp.]|uniref:PAAR domain-containing protein n=1 Tax=Paraburkholderia sp. TaxID=1926495 RepID=UPI002ED3E8A6
MRRIAVVGDQLHTGGHIEPYAGPPCTWDGHQVALIGGSAYCTTCKSVGSIVKTGGPRRIEFMGETAADGDIVLCKCSPPPRIIARLAGESWCDDEAEAYAASEARHAAENTPTGMSAATAYDERYTLMDGDGRALANVRYRVRDGSNVIANGVTDSSGRTQRISSEGTTRLALDIAP